MPLFLYKKNSSHLLGWLLLSVSLFLGGCTTGPIQELYFYGVFDNSDVYTQIINEYEADHPNVRIKYKKLDYHEYTAYLLRQTREQKPIDIFLHDGEIPRKNPEILQPLDPKIWDKDSMTVEFGQRLTNSCLRKDGSVHSVPQSIDSMVIYYNTQDWGDDFPSTWEEVQKRAQKWGKISAPIALGSVLNTDRWDDVFKALYLQKGNKKYLSDVTKSDKEAVFDFLSWFRKQWNIKKRYQLEEFRDGGVSAIASYNYKYKQIRDMVDGSFPWKVAPFPVFADTETKAYPGIAWYYSIGSTSRYPEVANDFIKFLTEPEQQKRVYESTYKIPATQEAQDELHDTEDGKNALTTAVLSQAPDNLYFIDPVWEKQNREEYARFIGFDERTGKATRLREE